MGFCRIDAPTTNFIRIDMAKEYNLCLKKWVIPSIRVIVWLAKFRIVPINLIKPIIGFQVKHGVYTCLVD